MADCVFCKIIERSLPADIIDENEHVIAIMSLDNHPMIIPKQHIKDIYELELQTSAEVMKMATSIAKAVKKATDCEGLLLAQFNGEVAGQSVFHFHMHIVPRWKGDGVQTEWDISTVDHDIRQKFAENIKKAL